MVLLIFNYIKLTFSFELTGPMASPNENMNVRQNRLNPPSGKRHNGKSIDVLVPPTRAGNHQPKRSMNPYSLAPYDDILNTIPPMLALNSTTLSVAAQSETKRDDESLTGASKNASVKSKCTDSI